MNAHDQEKLLKEILPPEDADAFREASLKGGLAGLRRERRRRHVVRLGAVAAVLVCVSLGIVLKSRETRAIQNTESRVSPAVVSTTSATHVEFINDEQLLALVKNQPVALIGKPGEQRLVFLGKSGNDSAPRQY